MPRPVTMPIANDKMRRPERTEAIRILKPAISNIPKSVSATVAADANHTVNEPGNRDVTAPVYSTKRAKFPQDTFFAPYGPHRPKRSATADRKEAPSANRANRRTISVPVSVSCAALDSCVLPRKAYCFMQKSFVGRRPFAGCVFLAPPVLISCLLFGRETHASTTQSAPLPPPTRNGPCREDGALHSEYLVCRAQRPPP